MRTGGQMIVEALEANGATHVFCVPGESYLAVLDALHDSPIRTVVCRQEGGAAMMADCHGRLTGEPGICFVTRGPGATNASAGVHIASQDSTPMILFIGQIARGIREREAFQEVDYKQFFGGMAKWVAEIDDAARIPEFVTRAFATATSGRPGPVVLVLPEDMLTDAVEAPATQRYTPVETAPSPAAMHQVRAMLEKAERPFVILGGSGWDETSVSAFQTAAERWALPVGVSFRRQMLFDHLHPCYAGDVGISINPALAARIKAADLLLLLGGRLSEMPSQDYTLLKSPYPDQTLIHVHASAEELGRVYRPALAVHSSPAAFARAFADLPSPAAPPAWANAMAEAHASYLKWSTPPETGAGAVIMGKVMAHLEEVLPDDAILTNGAGNYATWVHRFHRSRRFATQAAPTSGSMGYGMPAAVAAKLLFPEREVYAFAGDGCFMMHGQEFATAMHYGANIIAIVVNNGMYGTIRMHQEREYPARVSGTALTNPDFAALARASGKPAIIEIRLDPEALTIGKTLSEIRGSS